MARCPIDPISLCWLGIWEFPNNFRILLPFRTSLQHHWTGKKDRKLQVHFRKCLIQSPLFFSFSFSFYQLRKTWIDICIWIWLFLSCTRPVNVVCWKRAMCLEFMEKVGLMCKTNTLRHVNSSHIQFLVHGCSLCHYFLMQILYLPQGNLLNMTTQISILVYQRMIM